MAEPRQTIIVVDDDEGIRRQLRWAFDEFLQPRAVYFEAP